MFRSERPPTKVRDCASGKTRAKIDGIRENAAEQGSFDIPELNFPLMFPTSSGTSRLNVIYMPLCVNRRVTSHSTVEHQEANIGTRGFLFVLYTFNCLIETKGEAKATSKRCEKD